LVCPLKRVQKKRSNTFSCRLGPDNPLLCDSTRYKPRSDKLPLG
jgi:hypothetical protein